MQAIVIEHPGGPEVLKLQNVPEPQAKTGEITVRVHASAVNRADLLQRKGLYPAPAGYPQNIPGLEYAGEVIANGDSASDFNIGDRVFGLTGGGAYAQFITVASQTACPIPPHLSYIEAAAVPEAYMTAYDALVLQGGMKSGDYVLIQAVGSGVGVAAMQIVSALGATAIGTSRTKAKLDRLVQLGLHHAILVQDGKFALQVRELSQGRGCDLVLELVGGNYVEEDIEASAPKARIVLVGLVAGNKADINLGKLLMKRLTVIGTTMRARDIDEKVAVARAFSKALFPLFENGKLHPIIDRQFPLADARLAHELMESNEALGKVVLTML